MIEIDEYRLIGKMELFDKVRFSYQNRVTYDEI